jgi:hypothetical protein
MEQRIKHWYERKMHSLKWQINGQQLHPVKNVPLSSCFYRRSQRKPTANFPSRKFALIRGQLFLFISIHLPNAKQGWMLDR